MRWKVTGVVSDPRITSLTVEVEDAPDQIIAALDACKIVQEVFGRVDAEFFISEIEEAE